MATKLEELEVTSVDFVDRGANPDAHITLFKRDGQQKAPEKGDQPLADTIAKIFEDAASAVVKALNAGQAITPNSQNNPVNEPSPAQEDAQQTTGITKNETKGENSPMVDTSKMTPAEKAFYDDIVKRYSTADDTVEKARRKVTSQTTDNDDDDDDDLEKCKDTKKSADGVKKSVVTDPVPAPVVHDPSGTVPGAGEQEDIYKGLHPAVAAELKMLRKRADEEDERRLTDVAKKYEIIGKKPEELVPLLKSLKAAGGTAYSDMISVLDASLDAVNRSGVFEEIGKSGSYSSSQDNGAWSRIEKKADEIMAANPNMGRYQAIDMACMQNPSLVHEYENEM